eukprot:919728_1
MSTNDTTITEDTLRNDVQQIVYDSDLRSITQRSVYQQLQDKYGISLTQFKSIIYERSVEEARIRIQASPELQKQAMDNPKYFHSTISSKPAPKYFNTIYNTPHPSYLTKNIDPSTHNKSRKRRDYNKITNYQDVKKHYIGNGASITNYSDNSYESDEDNDNDNEPPLKRRKYGYNNLPYFNLGNYNIKKTSSSAQSKRENQKDIIYEFSPAFKEIMNRDRGTWRECWNWIVEYTTVNNLRISNRKIRCDNQLKKAFHREESSVTGVSRLIWKQLIGAVELDENGNFKKLVYKKRKKKVQQEAAVAAQQQQQQVVQEQINETEDEIEEDISEGDNNSMAMVQQQENINGNINVVKKKRRYRKRLRDENGNVIKKRKKSGLTRLCFMSDELKAIVGDEYCLQRNKITKGFWDYTKVENLKKPGRIIICDEKLKKIWGDETEQIHMFQVQKGLKAHITTMSKQEEKEYKLENPHLFTEDEFENGDVM